MSVGRRSRGLSIALFVGCLVWAALTLFPIYWGAITSVKPPNAVTGGPTLLPFVDFTPTLQAWSDAWSGIRGDFVGPFLRSALLSVTSAAIALVLGAMAAYALVRFEYRVRLWSGLVFAVVSIGGYLLCTAVLRWTPVQALGACFVLALVLSVLVNRLPLPGPVLGNDDIAFWFISQRMFPPIMAAFTIYLLYSQLGKAGLRMLDTYWGLLLCYVSFALPLVIWLLRDFFRSLPAEIEEAALVDNVPRMRIFFEIVVPMARPALIATFLLILGLAWNEFLFALMLTSGDWQTLPILLSGQETYRGDDWWAISVAAMVAILPMLAVTTILARFMRSGLLLGGIR